MAADVEGFLVPVVEEACRALNLQDNTGNYVTTDPVVKIFATVAYGQIESFLNRNLGQDTFNELYLDQDTRISLRNYPIESIVEVVEVDNFIMDKLTDTDESDPLVVTTDYKLSGNDLIVIRSDTDTFVKALQEFTVGSVTQSPGIHVRVQYVGGWIESTDVTAIHSALVMQTMANYNRRSTLGTMTMRGGDSSGMLQIGKNADSGDILDMVKTMLSNYVYYGTAVSV